jgi:hypothetical protein
MLASHQYVHGGELSSSSMVIRQDQPFQKRINLVSIRGKQCTPSPPGWEVYGGAAYTKERGYGWLTDISSSGWDGGGFGEMILPDGTRTSPRALSRLELANWQGIHQENRLLVFRIDLPDGWYRITCTSVDSDNAPLPLVDQRSIKFRAHDVVFAGPAYGAPLKIEGNRLVEGSGIVEVTDGHLRIVVGDPAYGGWTWSYTGPFWRGWRRWWSRHSWLAPTWYQKLTRTVDPGFHSLRFNSLEIEQVAAPMKRPSLFFRDFFNRDDNIDINAGIAEADRWIKTDLNPSSSDHIGSELYKTSLKLTGAENGANVVGLVQRRLSPEKGIIQYSTRVSLFTGEGSKIHSGTQEAGLLILADPAGVHEFSSTFIGIAYDSSKTDTPGRVKYRVGNDRDGYRTNSDIPDIVLPFEITEGEYEIIIEHDIGNNVLSQIHINGEDVTSFWALSDRQQRVSRGLFGIRTSIDPRGSKVQLQQFYWYYRVVDLS